MKMIMSAKRFEGKVVIITGKLYLSSSNNPIFIPYLLGSSSGIGQETALLFGKEGASVVIHGRSEKGLNETQKLLKDAGVDSSKILVIQGDICDTKIQDDLINKTIEKFGKIDILVNNAGLGSYDKGNGPQDVETLRYLMDVNVISGIRILQIAVPHLEKTKGNCVYVSSIVGMMAFPSNPFYAMTKAALDNWTKTAAVMYGPKGIRVNSVNPGGVATDFIRKLKLGDQVEKYVFDLANKENILERISKPEEHAEVIAFMASDKASYVNGSIFVVDGGHLLKRPSV